MEKDLKAEIPKVILTYPAACKLRNINTHTHTYLFPQTNTLTLTTKLKKKYLESDRPRIYTQMTCTHIIRRNR